MNLNFSSIVGQREFVKVQILESEIRRIEMQREADEDALWEEHCNETENNISLSAIDYENLVADLDAENEEICYFREMEISRLYGRSKRGDRIERLADMKSAWKIAQRSHIEAMHRWKTAGIEERGRLQHVLHRLRDRAFRLLVAYAKTCMTKQG